jgi:hypothetical protein
VIGGMNAGTDEIAMTGMIEMIEIRVIIIGAQYPRERVARLDQAVPDFR